MSGEVPIQINLAKDQQKQLAQIVQNFVDVFSEVSGGTKNAVYKTVTPEMGIVRERW